MTVEEIFRLGQQRWPGIQSDIDGFSRLLRAHEHADLAAVRPEDTFLAYACALGDAQAIAEFEESHMPAAVAAVRRMRGTSAAADDIAQAVRTHVLVAQGEALGKIVTYAGRGSLRRWVAAIAVRLYLNDLRRGKNEILIGDQELIDALGDVQASAELAHIKDTYRDDYRQGFSVALAELNASEKTLLRFRFVDGLTVTALAKLQSVHRSTMHRRLQDVQEKVAQRTEEILCDRLSIDPSEFASVRRLIRSQLDLSLDRLLCS